MIQITPQMRIMVAVQPEDFRKGIDGLARVCKEVLKHDPFGSWVFVFRNRPATALKVLVYDGQGFWLCHKRLSSGRSARRIDTGRAPCANVLRMVPGSRMVPDPSRSVRRQSRQSDLGGFAEPVLWYVRAKRTSGWATAAYRAQSLLRLGRGGFRRLLLHAIMVLTKPTIIELDMAKLEELLSRAEAALDQEDYATIKAVIESHAEANTESSAEVDPPADAQNACEGAGEGHGRNGADAYTGAKKVRVPHQSFEAGDACPECHQGTVYGVARPGVLVRIVGQAPVHAKVYYLEKLRCNLCGKVFTAQPPEGVGAKKYDATAGSMIALLKYGTGIPFHRAEKLQESLGIPLPASTQWDMVRDQAKRAEPVFEELTRQAAQGEVVFNDDTTVKILEMMGKCAGQKALAADTAAETVEDSGEDTVGYPAESPAENSAEGSAKKPGAERKGMFTSGIVSTREGRRIALFFSGRRHAGENLRDVLTQRAAGLPPPIQMCDALSRNVPAELETILAHCLAHGRRQFVDVAQRFPEECRHVLEALAVIYRNDALARERNLSPQERLHFHQAESGPTMEGLHAWLIRQFEERLVEPNSALGDAISYLLKYWEKLTLFLRVPGAPLDNNICERALKKAILHRKNALFYKTCRGAHVGDIFMSLIYTCELCGTNPFDYLTELERHADEASSNPQNWMPWNYRETLDSLSAPAASGP